MATPEPDRGHDVAVLGAGSWGTALAIHLARHGHRVRLWGHRPEHVAALAAENQNRRYLPGLTFPPELTPEIKLPTALAGAGFVIVAVPSHAFSVTLDAMAAAIENEITFAWATKGLEQGSGRFLLAIVHDHFGEGFPAAAISGPSFAIEVASGQPTALTVAAEDSRVAAEVAELLHGGAMRAYSSDDLTGVQLGGAAKNVIAIAAGISDGLGFGANARAALITRGLAEMVRLGVLAGGRADTLTGLAGLGDLVLTSTDDKSRNRRFGLALGRGVDQQAAKKEIGQVVEGADATRELLRLGQSLGCELPITEQVNAVLFEGRTPRSAVEALLARERRAEHE